MLQQLVFRHAARAPQPKENAASTGNVGWIGCSALHRQYLGTTAAAAQSRFRSRLLPQRKVRLSVERMRSSATPRSRKVPGQIRGVGPLILGRPPFPRWPGEWGMRAQPGRSPASAGQWNERRNCVSKYPQFKGKCRKYRRDPGFTGNALRYGTYLTRRNPAVPTALAHWMLVVAVAVLLHPCPKCA